MSDEILWFATRGAGIVSLLLFTATTCLGLITVVRWQSASWPRFLTAELHRSIALLSLAFLGLHIVTAIVDPFTSLGIVAALIPFASSYRPLWVGIGVVALDLLLAVIVTSLVRSRIGQRAWRAVHWAAYAAWPLALVHGLGAGTDAFAPWLLAIQLACLAAVGGALVWRIAAGTPNRDRLPDVVAARPTPGGTPYVRKAD
jgi:methionine sulfoxide reductase heme-binding subunit